MASERRKEVFQAEVLDSRAERSPRGEIGTLDVETLARWMDSLLKVPGLNLRFGLDAILGLLPGVGDVLTSAISFYILHEANRRGVGRMTLARMGFNIAIDHVLGSIPLIGDLFDFYWKSNERNVALLRRHVDANTAQARRLQRGDTWFVIMLMIGLAGLLVLSIMTAVYLAAWVLGTLGRLIG